MLIACTGEDTYRSLAKARELEAAFRAKYDPAGTSIERLPSGKDGVDALLSSLAAGSLFSTRRYFRADDIIGSCPKPKQPALFQALSRDVGTTIVVSLENKPLKKTELSAYTKLPKFIQYDFPNLEHTDFQAWAHAHAASTGFSDARQIAVLAEKANGNAWEFVNELAKVRAGGTVEEGQDVPGIYEAVDALFMRSPRRWSMLRKHDDNASVLSTALFQARAYVQVRSGDTHGIHSFVAKKLLRLPKEHAASTYLHLATSFLWSRTGRASPEESLESLN